MDGGAEQPTICPKGVGLRFDQVRNRLTDNIDYPSTLFSYLVRLRKCIFCSPHKKVKIIEVKYLYF